MTTIKLQFLYVALINVSILLLCEGVSRVIVWGVSGSPSIFFYGVSQTVQLDIVTLTPPNIDVYTYTRKGQKAENKKILKESSVRNEVWAFGGSTTQGYNCPPGQSSYPEKLEVIDGKFKVTNFGKGGTNSDYAIKELIKAIDERGWPEYVLWGNRVNEPDVIYRGVGRNFDRLKHILPNTTRGYKLPATILAHRVHKSLFERSVAYHLGTTVFRRIMIGRLNLHPIGVKHPTIEDYKLALANYRLNTSDAINYVTSRGTKFLIVLLPQIGEYSDGYSGARKTYENQFIAQAKELASKNQKVSVIHTSNEYFSEVGDLSQFCDGAHWNSSGHETLARIIVGKLKNL